MAYSNKPFIVPIFIPHAGCPHRCVFCNQSSITGAHLTLAGEDVRQQIETFLRFKRKRRHCVQIAFFGGNFLGIRAQTIKRLLTEAAQYITAGHADSIRFSTRPDTIDRQRLAALKNFPVSTIEIGAQSMDDEVLVKTNRGHSSTDTEGAVELLKEFDYEVGLQLMVGLPGDNAERVFASARRVARLKPDFVRIYPTVVLAGSPLAVWYEKGDYVPLSLEAAVTQTQALYLLFKKENIPVIRMGLQATEDLAEGSTVLAGPYHPAFGHLVYSETFLDMAMSAIKSANPKGERIGLVVHPRSVSKMRGLKNGNIKKLRVKFRLQSIEIVPDDSLKEDQLEVNAFG